MLAEALKDSRRHESTIDLSKVTLTHHALHKQPRADLDLSQGDAAGLTALVAAGSRGLHAADSFAALPRRASHRRLSASMATPRGHQTTYGYRTVS